MVRHLVWALPDPVAALRTWVRLLRPGGRLVLVEGRWGGAAEGTPYGAGAGGGLPWRGGVTAADLAAAVAPLVRVVEVEPLSEARELWGGPVRDERYALVAVR
ncbi:hypothetical protein BJP40_18235 [Streptomyces sp. CC53]|nr:hypothetical protein BJP40_18235 [Streptomyces sp. CC53]